MNLHLSNISVLFLCIKIDYFEEFRIENKEYGNDIYLEVINENLVRVMKSGQNAQSIKIKLTKKQTPCLTFEISLVSCFRNINCFSSRKHIN